MKKKSINFIMVILIFVSGSYIFGKAHPRLEVVGDKNIMEIILADIDAKTKFYYEIIPSIEKIYEEMWSEFNEEYNKWKDSGGGNEGKLPWCIFEAFNDLKKQKTIIIHLTIRKLKDFPNGRMPICPALGEYFSAKMGRSLWKGMWIFGLWKEYYSDIDSGGRYCLKAVIFHEMLHYALDISNRDYFNVRDIDNKKGTNNDNFWADEGIIEDCELKLFPCGDDPYKEAEDDWYKNNARKYNTSAEECLYCKLCNKKARSADDSCNPARPTGIPEYPGNDRPDDNFSYYDSENVTEYDLAPGSLVFTGGGWENAHKLFGGLVFDEDNTAGQLLAVSPVLIIPSGGLLTNENNSTLKYLLEKYVSLGGTLVIFTQQMGSHIENNVPMADGDSLKAYGWREDQSCLSNAVYFDTMHPVLSSSTSGIVDAGVDGYFSVYPSNSTVLLRRKINLEPALLYYPYGQGTVILSSLFTDYASSRSMASSAELRVVRDLITFARAPRLPIPMFNLEENPTPAVDLNVSVTNDTEEYASKVRLVAYTPDRKKVLYETEAGVSLNAGESAVIPVHFTLPEMESKDYGICHVDYELYDAQNELIRMLTESPDGRFSIYKIEKPANINDGFYQWITVKDENVYWGQDVECTIHLKNTTEEVKILDAANPFFYIAHGSSTIPFALFNITVQPGEEREHIVKLATKEFDPYLKSTLPFRIQYYDSNGTLRQIGAAKAVFLMGAATKSTLKLNNTSPVAPGGSLDYSISSGYVSSPLPGNTNIKLTLEKYDYQAQDYNEIKTLYQVDHDFSTAGNFQYNGIYTPDPVEPYGNYRLKLAVTSPNESKEQERYRFFFYDRSGFTVNLGKVQKDGLVVSRLIPGNSYIIPVTISNSPQNNNYPVRNGRCVIVVKSEGNREIYRKEMNGIEISPGEVQEISETFIFNPVETGRYTLEYAFTDETSGDNLYFKEMQVFWYSTNISIAADKSYYQYLETAEVGVNINGAGNYHIKFSCPGAGIDEERDVQIPVGQFSLTELFQVPIGLHSYYDVNVIVTDAANFIREGSSLLYVNPIEFDYAGSFKETFARAGQPLEFAVNIKGISGFSMPLVGELWVNCAGLSFDEKRTVTLQPSGDNRFTFSIPIALTVPADTYRFDVRFEIDHSEYINKHHSIILPGVDLKSSIPGNVFNGGDTVELTMENTGGKAGTFYVEILLRDEMGKTAAQLQDRVTFASGETRIFDVLIPIDSKSGKYLLIQKAVETGTQGRNDNIFPLQIIGLSAVLNSYTLKEKYFGDEPVGGRSEITPGNKDISGGLLTAEIVKIVQRRAIEKINDHVECLAVDSLKRLWAGTYSGLSVYAGGNWQGYTELSDGANGTWIGLVTDIVRGPGDKIYALADCGIIMVDGNQLSTIPRYYQAGFGTHTLAVDNLSRVWLNYHGEVPVIAYYDMTYSEWNFYEPGIADVILSDRKGGVWIFYYNKLVHVKADLSREQWTPDTGLPAGDIQNPYVDPDGTLWFSTYYRYLYSFDGTQFIDHSGKSGYPVNGIFAVIGDETNTIYGIGVTDEWGNDVYRLDRSNEEFVQLNSLFNIYSYDEWIPLTACDGYVYTNGGFGAGGEGGGSPGEWGLLKIGGGSGTGDEIAWSNTYPITASAGETLTVDLTTDKAFDPGFYFLRTRLSSSLDQVLAASTDTFSVIDHDVSVSLLTAALAEGFVKASVDLPVSLEVFNDTAGTYSSLGLRVKKVSPSGTEDEILSENLALAAGQKETRNITFNEPGVGTWELKSQLSDNTSGVVLSETVMLIRVAEPLAAMEIQAPQYAGDEPVEVRVRLLNTGNITAELVLQVSISGGGSSIMEETIALKPLEERVLTFTETLLAADRSYTVILGGDSEQTETVTVRYGYKEQFNIDILPAYREGPISIGYSIANSGGLTFTDNVHMELFSLGGTTPLYTFDRIYTLYPVAPGEFPINDSIDPSLPPGNFQLKYYTSLDPVDRVATFVVQPSGIGTISLASFPNGAILPVGSNYVAYTITNSDTTAGNIPITLTVSGPNQAAPLFSETRSYYLLPGQSREDGFNIDFPQKGQYTLSITGSKLPVPFTAILQVVNPEDISAQLTIGTIANGFIPVNVSISNTGYHEFTGVVSVETGGVRSQETITVLPGNTFNGTVSLSTNLLTPGAREVNAYLYDPSGALLSQTSSSVEVKAADIQLIEIPQDLEIAAGGYAEIPLKLKNEGHIRGEAVLKVTAFDTLRQEREIMLEPGQEIGLTGIFIDAAPDLATGTYPVYYTLSAAGTTGTISGNFLVKVNGIALEVEAELDRSLYNVGETAQLTMTIGTTTPGGTPLEAVVNWGNFNERRGLTLSSGSESLVFNIPLEEEYEGKVFYGIYHEGGKGIHLNDIYLYFRGDVSVETDRQVYAPGEAVQAVFSSEQSGVLTAEAFGESHTLNLSSSASASFMVPGDTLGGTYGIRWDFVPADTSQPACSGSHPFDVGGLVVKVAKSALEKGKYAPGETVRAYYIFESNRDETLSLRSWVTAPSGAWTYLGESSTALSASRQVHADTSYTFTNTGSEAGTHEWVYGLYTTASGSEQLVVSGSMGFDVGNAVLLGIIADRYEYPAGNENVHVKIDYFGQGTAQMELFLDDEKVETRSLTLDGVGSTEITLNSSRIEGGGHGLKAVLIKDGLTSAKSTGFIYGTHLPDLAIYMSESLQDGLDYTYKLEVANNGKSASAASSLTFSDNGAVVQTVSLASLQPGQSHEILINWSGSGKAGTHDFVFTVDPADAVREFCETNNTLELSEEVAALFYTLAAEPALLPANTTTTIITRLINNRETPGVFTLDLAITNDNSGAEIFQRTRGEKIPAFGGKTLGDNFNTGVYPAGEYTISQALSGADVSMNRQTALVIESTKALSSVMQVSPVTVPSGVETDVQVTLTLKNAGNVPLENETALLEVWNKDTDSENDTAVKSDELPVNLAISEEKIETRTLVLNLVEGQYDIRLTYNDELIASASLTAAAVITPEKTVDIHPRVLLMNLHPPMNQNPLLRQTEAQTLEFLEQVLHSQSIEHETADGILPSYVKLHRGHSNVSIVWGRVMGRNFRDELKERVWRGEGLIWVVNNPLQQPDIEKFLGAGIKPLPGKKAKENRLHFFSHPLTNGSEFDVELASVCGLYLIPQEADVEVVAETKQGKQPVMIYRKYGKGHLLVVVFPLQFKTGAASVIGLLVNAVNGFSQDVYSAPDLTLTRILPLSLVLTNGSAQAKTLTIKEILPYGVEGYGYEPEPEAGEEIKWKITVPASGTETISYWLRLPDRVKSYEVKSELYDESGTRLKEVSLSFEVLQTVVGRIDEPVLELESLQAGGKDSRHIRNAVRLLEKVRNRSGDSLLAALENVLDMVGAAGSLGEVEQADVSLQRLSVQEIMVVMGWRFFEKVKALSQEQLRLTPLYRLITED